jgi:hypothetical protein
MNENETQILNWSAGRMLVTKNPNARYEVEILNRKKRNIIVTYNGVTKNKIIQLP